MAIAAPAFAIVRPRVVVKRTGEAGLLEDIVSEIADEYGSGFVRLTGGPGSGKSTAIAHLAAVFSYHEHFVFLDEPTADEISACSSDSIAIAATPLVDGRNMELVLQPWGMDELIEYLLALHHDDCGSVISRLGAAAKRPWCPQLACIVMGQFAADYELHDASDALAVHMRSMLRSANLRQAVTEFCVATLVGGIETIAKANNKLEKMGCPAEVRALLRHELVQLPLAAARIIGLVLKGCFTDLEKPLPFGLIELVGWQCGANSAALDQLKRAMALQRAETAHAMMASVLLIAEPIWRPESPRKPWRLSRGIFRAAQWPELNFFRANLDQCDFSGANLEAAQFETADLTKANFTNAKLRGAKLLRARAPGAFFCGADLSEAKLSCATLNGADFSNADLSKATLMTADLTSADMTETVLRKADLSQANLVGSIVNNADFSEANLTQANLSNVDLRTAHMNGACLEGAILRAAQLEDILVVHARLKGANLSSAHLTGSALPAADLRDADLRGAELAKIDWEEADLRGANLVDVSFHMGSSRSGLVDSPYACEGSKTGFYTDDFEDLSFKRPEEIRKANLANADLRDVRAERVDFYLVDLRGAKMDADLREQARESGAILHDPEK
jgi:uncharacterized protein YjbI with pentapeptide repeats